MRGAVGLFEYLAVPAIDALPTTQEPAGARYVQGALRVTPGDMFDGTHETRQDNDTYDDDAGVGTLGVPNLWLDGTTKTSSRADTYDESTDAVCFPPCLFSTSTTMTETDNETYDEDDSLEGLALPTT